MLRASLTLAVVVCACEAVAGGPGLQLAARSSGALEGHELAQLLAPMPPQQREARLREEVLSGNVPDFYRHFVPVQLSETIDGKVVTAVISVAPDYLAIGSDTDHLFVPLTPYTAQKIADQLDCRLPTPKMVDAIYRAATVKLEPSPIPPTKEMVTVPQFWKHSQVVDQQRMALAQKHPLGELVAGDKKDVVITNALDSVSRVAIYGWHRLDGKPIQPVYTGHSATWADYSHGIRLVMRKMIVDGKPTTIDAVLADPKLCILLSGEGPVTSPRYRLTRFPVLDDPTIRLPQDERLLLVTRANGIRVAVNEPAVLKERVRLVIFALPNGNTIEQTFGRKMRPDDDWHYDIQHIGAQTRFVRHEMKDESLVVAYVEAPNHAWPAFIHTLQPSDITILMDAIFDRYKSKQLKVTLDSHSGGGALEFAYIRALPQIPDWIDRIAFLDSEYNYDTALHSEKLTDWLKKDDHYLCAIAYDDASARYQGKPFVSAQGGTWGRSHAMLADLGKVFPIARTNSTDPERWEGLNGRLIFLLKENPTAAIFHTVQVERNGFIESLLSGTPLDGQGYEYFGDRAYRRYIHD